MDLATKRAIRPEHLFDAASRALGFTPRESVVVFGVAESGQVVFSARCDIDLADDDLVRQLSRVSEENGVVALQLLVVASDPARAVFQTGALVQALKRARPVLCAATDGAFTWPCGEGRLLGDPIRNRDCGVPGEVAANRDEAVAELFYEPTEDERARATEWADVFAAFHAGSPLRFRQERAQRLVSNPLAEGDAAELSVLLGDAELTTWAMAKLMERDTAERWWRQLLAAYRWAVGPSVETALLVLGTAAWRLGKGAHVSECGLLLVACDSPLAVLLTKLAATRPGFG
jgi:hypothetical protein